MTIVIALGGNAILSNTNDPSIKSQDLAIAKAISFIKKAFKNSSERLVITHGNGPQVGFELLKNLNAKLGKLPLYALSGETQASIGSTLALKLSSALRSPASTVLTHVVVDPRDPAFAKPSKPIGPLISKSQSVQAGLASARFGNRYQLLAPSPRPLKILEESAIRAMPGNVVCCGGGGIPVDARLKPLNAVVDKDLTSSLLATRLHAKILIILTNVSYVYSGFGTSKSTPIKSLSSSGARELARASEPGSMMPKLIAAADFIENGGKKAYIGRLDSLDKILKEKEGTIIK